MKKLARVTTVLMLAAAVLAGCGGDDQRSDDPQAGDPSTATADTVEETDWGKPATGPVISGDGYTYRAPQGWGDVTKGARSVQSMVDSAASEKAATGGFAENVTVGFQSSGASLDQLEEAVPARLGSMVKDLETLPRVTIDGVESLHFRGPAVSAGTKYFLEQLDVVEDDRIAIIIFSFSRDLPARKRDVIVSTVMASWKWTA
jgi:hypothetical protein